MKFYVHSFGCKVNQVEREFLSDNAFKNGFCPAKNLSEAEMLIINSCAVTEASVKKLSTFISKIKEKKPNVRIAVTGCAAELSPEDIMSFGADMVITNPAKFNIYDYIKTGKSYTLKHSETEKNEMPVIKSLTSHTRAFVMIQEGCDAGCSYCIIPLLRGKPVSKPKDVVLEEIDDLVYNGYKEIVPVGIHVGKYGEDFKEPCSLLELLKEVEQIKGNFRIRLTSIEVNELNDDFLRFFNESAKVCPHAHIPLQSGSDRILKLMNRKYTTAEYIETCQKLKSLNPDIRIGADLITGFPSETDEDVEETIKTLKSAGVDFLHVFPYSDRPETPASKMEGKVSDETKKHRAAKLRQVGKELKKAAQEKMIGRTVRVLTEKDNNGLTGNYHRVYFKEDVKPNIFIETKITSFNEKGELIGEPAE